VAAVGNAAPEADRQQRAGHVDATFAFARGGKPPVKLQHCVRSIWLEQPVRHASFLLFDNSDDLRFVEMAFPHFVCSFKGWADSTSD
jgi:hypothetical protein